MKELSFTLALVACFNATCLASELSGVVKSSTGKPISGVTVSSPPSLYSDHQTAADGSFRLDLRGEMLHFWHPDYRPLTKIVTSPINRIEVILDDAAGAQWIIPPCSSATDPGRRVGNGFRLLMPKGSKFRTGGDADYTDFYISYGSNERAWLQGIYGPHASSGYPFLQDVRTSAAFNERSWKSGKFSGLDMHGNTADGKHWRFVGTYGEQVSYHDVSAEEATFFDKIIDGVCFGR